MKKPPGRSARVIASAALAALACVLSAVPLHAQSLVWVDTRWDAPSLNRCDTEGLGVVSQALTPGSLPEGVAVGADGRVYWAEAAWSGARLQRASSSFGAMTPLVTGGSSLRGVAVDDPHQRLYWTSSHLVSGGLVHSATITGGSPTTWPLPPGANPRGIAVDPVGGSVYWADFDLDAIYRADLDGANAGVWMTLPAGTGPYGVAYDGNLRQVFWTEYNTGQIRRASLSGATVTVASGLANPTYLALDVSLQKVYWIDAGSGVQHLRLVRYDGSSLATLPPAIGAYGGIAFASGATTGAPTSPPLELAVERAWPSPGPGPFHLGFSLPGASRVRLAVLDLQGRELAVLADGDLPAGRYDPTWSGRLRGAPAPPGLYFARLAIDGRVWTRRVVLTR